MSNIYWVNDFSGGINQNASFGLSKNNQSRLLVNTTLEQSGAVATTNKTLDGNSVLSGAVVGASVYNKSDGTQYIHVAVDDAGDAKIDVYSEASGSFSLQTTAYTSIGSLSPYYIDFENFIGRHYLIDNREGAGYLKYITETGSATLVTGNVNGKYLASNNVYLMVAGAEDRKNYWSKVADGTFDTANDFVYTSTPATGIASFGDNLPFLVFTRSDIIRVDPATGNTRLIEGFGCTDHQTIQNVRGYVIWASDIDQAVYLIGPQDRFPTEISRIVKNPVTEEAFMNAGANGSAAMVLPRSFVVQDKYYLQVGFFINGLGVSTSDILNPILEFDLSQKTWSMIRGVAFRGHHVVFNQNNGLRRVYQFNASNAGEILIPYTRDGGNAQKSIILTKNFTIPEKSMGELARKQVNHIYLKYGGLVSPQVEAILDGNGNLPIEVAAVGEIPKLNGTSRYSYAKLAFGEECNTIQLRISATGNFVLYGIGFEVAALNSTGLPTI